MGDNLGALATDWEPNGSDGRTKEPISESGLLRRASRWAPGSPTEGSRRTSMRLSDA
jgi:hypothetical protein